MIDLNKLETLQSELRDKKLNLEDAKKILERTSKNDVYYAFAQARVSGLERTIRFLEREIAQIKGWKK